MTVKEDLPDANNGSWWYAVVSKPLCPIPGEEFDVIEEAAVANRMPFYDLLSVRVILWYLKGRRRRMLRSDLLEDGYVCPI